MKIGFILGHQQPGPGSWLHQVIGLLCSWGVRVDAIYPGRDLIDLSQVCVEHDLYVLRPSNSELVLSYAGILHDLGARMLNPYPVSALLRDKMLTTHKLQKAGVPVPHTVVVLEAEQVRELLALGGGALIVKPCRGHLGEGVRLIRSPDDIQPLDGVHLAQQYHRPDGLDRKIYSIGGHVFGVSRKFPAQTYEEKMGTPFTVEPELLSLTKCCGDVFGIDTFGVDVIVSDGKPYVVDMSEFPGFKGVPDAATRIADYLSYHLGHVKPSSPPVGIIQTRAGS